MSILQEAKTWELNILKEAYQKMVDELSAGFKVSKNTVEYYQNKLNDVEAELNKRK